MLSEKRIWRKTHIPVYSKYPDFLADIRQIAGPIFSGRYMGFASGFVKQRGFRVGKLSRLTSWRLILKHSKKTFYIGEAESLVNKLEKNIVNW